MELCSDDHEEICYETNPCPLCDCKKELTEAAQEIETLEDRIETMNDDMKDANMEIAKLGEVIKEWEEIK